MLVIVLGTAAWLLHRDNLELNRELTIGLPAPAKRDAAVPAPMPEPATSAVMEPDQLRAELVHLRQQVARAETQALEKRAKYVAQQAHDAEMMATNHDATKGLARVENLQNCGQATPSAALQTLVWATFNGDEATMNTLFTLSEDDRKRTNAVIAQLPAESQRNWTPEKIADLFLTSRVNDMTAVEITSERSLDAQTSAVTLRFPGYNKHATMIMKLGPTGWRLVVPNVGYLAQMYVHGNG